MKSLRLTFASLVAGFCFSCQKHPVPQLVPSGDPKPVKKNPAGTQDRVESLDTLKKLRLSNATLFLWKQDSTDVQLADVLRGLRKYDDVEDDSYDFGMIMARLEDLASQRAKLEEDAKRQNPKPTEQELSIITQKMVAIDAELKSVEASKEKLYAKYGGEDKLMAEMSENGDRLEKLFKVVDTVDTNNPTFLLDVKEEGLSLEIEGVNFVVGQPAGKFSTENGTIRKLEFKSVGAVLNFDVHSDSNVVFEFRLRRVSYDDKGGRIIFKGDMNKLIIDSNGQILEKRVGQAKINTNYKN